MSENDQMEFVAYSDGVEIARWPADWSLPCPMVVVDRKATIIVQQVGSPALDNDAMAALGLTPRPDDHQHHHSDSRDDKPST